MASSHQLVDALQDQNDAALALAEAIAGGDRRRTIELFTTFTNVADLLRVVPKSARITGLSELVSHGQTHARSYGGGAGRGLGRGRTARTGPSIFSDPLYLRNARKVITRHERIVNGKPTAEFNDCVAIGGTSDWCCTGTIVAPNVVVTAAHCARGDCAARIFIGTDVKKLSKGRVVRVAHSYVHPKYRGPDTPYDLSVLVLEEKVSVAPRRIASRAAVARAESVRVVGFGTTDTQGRHGYGLRRVVDVPMATAKKAYGALPSVEFVAAAPFNDNDTCKGDSGGPAYVADTGGWSVGGATSRGTRGGPNSRTCGDGGIYTRLYAFRDWIKSRPGVQWKA